MEQKYLSWREKISFLGNSIKGNFHFRLDRKLPKKAMGPTNGLFWSCGFPKKEFFWSVEAKLPFWEIVSTIRFPEKEFFDGLCKRVIWLFQNDFWGAYVSRSCDFPKKEILMAYISIPKTILEQEFPFLVILMAYINQSCDPQKARKYQIWSFTQAKAVLADYVSWWSVNMDVNSTKPNQTYGCQ